MAELMFPKEPKKEKEPKPMARSSIHRKKPKKRYKQTEKQKERAKLERERKSLCGEKCWVCGKTTDLTYHEIFFGPNRDLSLKYGMVVRLCYKHHEHIHRGLTKDYKLELKQYGQQEFKKMYPDIDFMSVFGKSYL